jgi:alkylation response protein AidB-like acyl-CoA dehydrogenase
MRQIAVGKCEHLPLTKLKDDEERYILKVFNFAENHIRPFMRQMDEVAKMDDDLIRKLFEFNLMNIGIPREYGGDGLGFFNIILAIETLARVDPAVAVFVDVQNTLINNVLINWGTEDQKKKYLPELARKTVAAFSITEKEAGSDAYALKCSAEEVKGGYLLTGEKHWATNAAEADLFIIFAKVHSKKYQEALTAFLIDKQKAIGLVVEPPADKMGIRASSTCDLILNKVFVPTDNVLGGIGRARRIALETLTDGRIGIAAQMLGLAVGAFNVAIEYSQTRRQFGKYIASFQGVHFPLADLATKIEAVRLMVYNAARIKMAGGSFDKLFTAASMAKYLASEVAEEVVSSSLDIVSGVGYMKGNPIEKFYRDAKVGKIYEGTTNIQLRSIARRYIRIKMDEVNS